MFACDLMERDLLLRLSRFLDQERPFEDAGFIALIVNVDAVGYHDRRPRKPIERLAKKAIIASASDVVAKSARPRFFALYVSHEDKETVYKLVEKAYETIKRLGAKGISGDTDSESLRIVSTAIGFSHRYVTRYKAKPGDGVYLLGPIGHGGALSVALKRNIDPPEDALRLIEYDYFDPSRADVVGSANASMDVSDSLAITLRDIAELSGVRIEVDYERLRKLVPSGISRRAEEHGIDPAELALYGGDEYVIVYTGEYHGGELIGRVLEGSGVNAKRLGWEHR